MSSALACVGLVAVGTTTGRAPRGALGSKRFHAKATSSALKGSVGRSNVRGAQLLTRAEAITDAPEKDAKAEEVRGVTRAVSLRGRVW